MHRRRNQLTIAAVAFVLGLLVIVQLRTQQSGAAFAGLSSQDLTVLVANLNARNDQLRREAANLQRELSMLSANAERGDASIDFREIRETGHEPDQINAIGPGGMQLDDALLGAAGKLRDIREIGAEFAPVANGHFDRTAGDGRHRCEA